MGGTGQKVMEAEGIQTSSPLLSHCSQINWQPIKAIKKLTHTSYLATTWVTNIRCGNCLHWHCINIMAVPSRDAITPILRCDCYSPPRVAIVIVMAVLPSSGDPGGPAHHWHRKASKHGRSDNNCGYWCHWYCPTPLPSNHWIDQ